MLHVLHHEPKSNLLPDVAVTLMMYGSVAVPRVSTGQLVVLAAFLPRFVVRLWFTVALVDHYYRSQ